MSEEAAADAGGGLPGWVMTFADLMTLLMCFFVLMLSFSEMDVAKFKQLAGSMKEAFGVQNEIEVKTIPKGTSIIAQEFSPGRPERTILNEVRQYTLNSNQNSLDVGQRRLAEIAEQEERARRQAEALRAALAEEIAAGKLLIRRESTDVIVQILEKDSFRSGSAQLEPDFLPTLSKIGGLLNGLPGALTVSGHTDNIPISTSQYRSNWDLAAARAATVAHRLLETEIDPARMMITGHADTQPRALNDSAENRALNRRIDITLVTNRDRHGTFAETGGDTDTVLPGAVTTETEPAPAADTATVTPGDAAPVLEGPALAPPAAVAD